MYRVVQESQLLWFRMTPLDGRPGKRVSMRVPVGEPRLELIEGSVAPEPVRYPATQAEEVWQLVQEWYAGRLEPVPEEDRTACMKMLEEECVPAVAAAPAAAPKPAHGTPEFWKAHWAKKRAAAAAAAAQTTNPPAPVPLTHTAVPKAKPPPKTPAAKATAQAGAPQESKSSA